MRIEKENGFIEYSYDDYDETYTIDLVQVNEKRKGTGSELVREVLSIAREEEIDVTLCAYPQDDSISLDDLINFYENLGFEIDYDDGKEALMTYSF